MYEHYFLNDKKQFCEKRVNDLMKYLDSTSAVTDVGRVLHQALVQLDRAACNDNLSDWLDQNGTASLEHELLTRLFREFQDCQSEPEDFALLITTV